MSTSENVVWKDPNGELFCPGDACPKDCDVTCPIYLNTIATQMYHMGEKRKAAALFLAILDIEPNFYGVLNNLGMYFGECGNYQDAYEYYSKAYAVKPNQSQNIFGLALATRDLKRYDECIKWCNEYDKYANDHRCDSIRDTAIRAKE